MTLIRCNYFSSTLDRDVGAYVALPEYQAGETLPVCYLLHDFYENYTKWVRRIPVERLADKFHMAMVMPDGNKSFYLDAVKGENYFTYISEELPDIMAGYFPVSSDRQDVYLAGAGMGGYGAFRMMLLKPEKYQAAAGFNAMTDIRQVMLDFAEHPSSISRQAEGLFGGLDEIEGSEADLFHLLEQENSRDTALYVSYDSRSPYLQMNKEFAAKAEQKGLTVFDEQKEAAFLEEFLYQSLDGFLTKMKCKAGKEKWDIFSTYRDYGCV